MFDTSLVRSHSVAAPRRAGLLTASVALHSALAFAVFAMSIANVEFPGQAPDQLSTLQPIAAVSLPPPLGTGKQPREPEPVRPKAIIVPATPQPSEVAPEEVPSEVEVATTGAGEVLDTGVTNGTGTSDGDGAAGDPLGVPGGLGDDLGAVAGLLGDTGPRIPGGEVRSARVLRRVEPRYPRAMIPARIRTAVVTVRCVIDRSGRVREPEVLTSSWPAFDQSVIDAVKQWTFTPGTLRGHPIDTWFELTVTFEVR